MTSFDIKNNFISKYGRNIFIVAEIGQNHQGNIEIAKEMIIKAKEAGCDCVKFQKSDLTTKFTKSALDRPYLTVNSWGKTYREHKEFLEFSLKQIEELKNFANDLGILFSVSAMDEISLEHLANLNLPFIKIGSGDANNFRLLKQASKLTTPLIISTGMQDLQTIYQIIEIMKRNDKKNFCILHCVSSYPTKPENVNLLTIQFFQERYPNIVVGYSGHEEDIIISLGAVLLGAKVIERHFTLDKTLKGTDHKCSLTPSELTKLVKRIRTLEDKNMTTISSNAKEIEQILIKEIEGIYPEELETLKLALKKFETKSILPCELPCRNKLGKSLVYARSFKSGHILNEDDIAIKVCEPFTISSEYLFEYIGKQLCKDVDFDQPLIKSDF